MTAKGAKALSGGQVEEAICQLHVVRVRLDLGPHRQAPPTRRRKSLERLP